MRTILLSAVFAALAGTAYAQDYAPAAPPAVELPEGSPPSALLPRWLSIRAERCGSRTDG